MPSYFEGFSDFVPDATQGFNDEFVRLAASQNLVKGTPQFNKARTAAASQCIRDEYFTPQGRARRERIRRQHEYERLEQEERDKDAVEEEEVHRDSEDDLPELNEDDNESVVSLDVGFSQVFTSDIHVNDENSDHDEDLEDVAESVKEEVAPGKGIKEEPIIDDVAIDLLPVDESDNESVVSMDQGLTQVFTSSSTTCAHEECPNDSEDDRDKQRGVTSLRELTKEEQLLGWQALCRETGRTIGKTIWECRTVLKKKPYVNIIDYIDAARVGAKIELFHDFAEFSHYTMTTPGKCIPLKDAKEDELLSALLQKVNRSVEGPKDYKHGKSFRQHHPSIRKEWRRTETYGANGRGSEHSRTHERSRNARVRPY
ncbi:uncharacterized protein N0V89_006766 [Didymosphaeria variabile]|uniref:Uncharacterized protein n=1 Tax=Didymosphaeria variabile TaxID=1932322 RepID=A0A9W8XHZ3_9PLEO|nr:uncharacterized protein N0V89_006766 [Didymosphaeria variabile]KAJ4351424.1 hypothetical protein N0V89_006766 [Didymosphaeria variabile]